MRTYICRLQIHHCCKERGISNSAYFMYGRNTIFFFIVTMYVCRSPLGAISAIQIVQCCFVCTYVCTRNPCHCGNAVMKALEQRNPLVVGFSASTSAHTHVRMHTFAFGDDPLFYILHTCNYMHTNIVIDCCYFHNVAEYSMQSLPPPPPPTHTHTPDTQHCVRTCGPTQVHAHDAPSTSPGEGASLHAPHWA